MKKEQAMCKTANKTATANGVHGVCRWIQQPIYPCTLIQANYTYPQGASTVGVLQITSHTSRGDVTADYAVTTILAPRGTVASYQLVNQANGEVYDITPKWVAGQWKCTCADHLYRQHECKHALALQAALKEINLL